MGAAYTRYNYEIRENNFTVLKSGVVDLASGTGTLEATLDHPGMVYARLSFIGAPAPVTPPTQQELDKMTVGAAVAPEQIQAPPKPADFDTFWATKLAALQQVPINAKLEPVKVDVPNVDLFAITADSLNSQMHGYLAVPKTPGKHPALIYYQYAGVYPLQKSQVTDRAAEGLDEAQSRAPTAVIREYLRNSISIADVTREIWSGRLIVVAALVFGLFYGLYQAHRAGPLYMASVEVLPADSDGASSGGSGGGAIGLLSSRVW